MPKVKEQEQYDKYMDISFDDHILSEIYKHEKHGLHFVGMEDGEPQYMGTEQAWRDYETNN